MSAHARHTHPGVVPGHEGFLHRSADALLPYFSIAFLTGLAYLNSLHATFHYDDVHVVVENLGIRGFRTFLDYLPYQMNRPLLAFTFMLNYLVSGLKPEGYRITNIALHVVNACLIYRWVKELAFRWVPISDRKDFDVEKIAWMAAILFALHPTATEAVTYVSSRSSVLCTTFILLCLISADEALWRWPAGAQEGRAGEGAGPDAPPGRGSAWPWRMGAVLFFLAGMGTKEIAASVPAILLAHDAILVRPRRRGFRTRLARFHPVFFVLLGFTFLVRGLAVGGFDTPPTGVTTGQYWLSELRALPFYARLLLLPTNLNVDPAFAPSLGFDLPVAVALGSLIVSTILALWLIPRYPLVAFGAFFFLVAHTPTSLIPLQDLIAERRDYLPSIGFLLVVAWAFFRLARSPLTLGRRGENRTGGGGAVASFVLCAFLLVFFCAGTIHRNGDWQDPVTLWADAVRKSPWKARPHANLGSALGKSGDVIGALREFEEALEIDPDYADAHLNLGTVLLGLNRREESERHLERAAKLNPSRPSARNRLGELYIDWGKLDKAEEVLDAVARESKADRETYYLLGLAHYRMARMDEAAEDWREGSHRWPKDGRLHRSLGLLLYKEGRKEEAISELRLAVSEDPSEWAARSALRELDAGRGIQVR